MEDLLIAENMPTSLYPIILNRFCGKTLISTALFKTVVDDAKFIIFKADADQDRPNVL